MDWFLYDIGLRHKELNEFKRLRLKLIFHWKVKLLIFVKTFFKLFADKLNEQ